MRPLVVGLGVALTPAARRFRRALADPEGAQTRLEARLARAHARTTWGKRYDVDGRPGSLARLPVVSWADIAGLVERERRGALCEVTPGRVQVYEPTSGSGGPQKPVPYTRELLDVFRSMFAVWAHDVIRHGPPLSTGRFYFSISPPTLAPPTLAPPAVSSTSPSGQGDAAAGLDDDADYLAPWLRAALGHFFVRPRAGARPTAEAFKDATALALLACRDLEVVSVWNPSFLTVHLDHIVERAGLLLERLAREGSTGRARAQALRPLFAPGPSSADPELWRAVWPSLKLLSCWTDAGAAAASARLAARLPHVYLQGKGLLATEAPVTIPLVELDSSGGSGLGGQAPLLVDVLVELEEVPGSGRVIPLHCAEQGGRYGVVVSPRGGLPRYRLGDLVEVRGRLLRTPLLRFLGRADAVSDLVGEKLEAAFVGRVLEALLPGAFATLVPIAGERPRYLCLTDASLDNDHAAELAHRLDAALREAHHYERARLLGQLDPVQVRAARDAEAQLLAAWRDAGRRAGDLKPQPLHVVALPLAGLSTLRREAGGP